MGKRKENEKLNPPYRIKRPKLLIRKAPPINSLEDLIELGKSIHFYSNIDSIMLWKICPHLEELNEMVGMKSLKETIFYQIVYYMQNMHSRNKNADYLNTIITGPPGCGKTSVSKILGKIYKSLGIIKGKGGFKVGYRNDFVAGYLGQTANKTNKFLKSCLGGVLFIDEVYALGPGQDDRDSFSKEALDTLTSFLSEHVSDFCCIAAGYEKDIRKCFFRVNKGLESRFPWVHKIEPYDKDDLAEIYLRKVKNINWECAVEKEKLGNFIHENIHLFENTGRDIETFVSKCKIVHAKRIINLDPSHKFIITEDDLKNALKFYPPRDIEKNEIPEHMYT